MTPHAVRTPPAAAPLARLLVLALLTLSASGCDLVAGIFKAGFWVGIILVVLIVAVVAWGARAFSRRGPR